MFERNSVLAPESADVEDKGKQAHDKGKQGQDGYGSQRTCHNIHPGGVGQGLHLHRLRRGMSVHQ